MEMKPLNIFQRCIRVWEQAHPYNAAQVLHLAGPADLAKITDAWNQVLATSGLGIARVVGRRFCYEPAPRQEVAVVDPTLGLDGFITREINRPFDVSSTMPFRPFVLSGGGAYHFGVIYQHWVADSVSLRMLLREWFCRLYDPAHVTAQPLHIPHGGFWRYFGPGRAGWSLPKGMVSLLRSTRQFSRARRIEKGAGAQHVEVSLHQLPDGMVDALLEVIHRRGAGGGVTCW